MFTIYLPKYFYLITSGLRFWHLDPLELTFIIYRLSYINFFIISFISMNLRDPFRNHISRILLQSFKPTVSNPNLIILSFKNYTCFKMRNQNNVKNMINFNFLE